MDMELAGQILGFIAVILGIISFQMKTAKKLVIMNLAVCVTFCMHYFCIGAYSGLALNFVGVLRNIFYANKNSKFYSKRVTPVIFAIIMGVMGVLSWQGAKSLLVISGLVINTVCMSFENPQNIRKSILVTSPLVLIYDIIEFSIGGMIYETMVIVSSIVGIFRYKNRKHKMITCDLDGTLYNSKIEVSFENNKAIRKFAEMGIPFVPCTGRTLSEMSDVAENPDIRYIIYSTGAAILDKKTGEIIDCGLKGEIKDTALDILSRYETYIFAHIEGKVATDAKLRGEEKEYNLNDVLCGIAENMAVHPSDFDAFTREKNVECMCVFFKNDEEKEKCRNELLESGKVDVAEPWPCNLEIFDKSAGKENALKILANKLGIDIKDVISIGDSDNDMRVVGLAGLGISTSNGSEELKKIADEVACSNDEHVAAYVLNKYFKG